jgi:flagellin-like hook-associated protein FlgL
MAIVSTDFNSLFAFRNLSGIQKQLSSSIGKLSSGLRVNKFSDDPSGTVPSVRFSAPLGGIRADGLNARDDVSLLRIAGGSMPQSREILPRMRGLVYAINSLQAMEANTVAAKSNITDADMASEVARFSKLQIISQAGLAAISTRNIQNRVPGMLYSL